MNEEEKYKKEINKAFESFSNKIADIQDKYSFDLLGKLSGYYTSNLLFFIKQSVGEDMFIHYLIEMLSTSSKYYIKINNLLGVSEDRAKMLKKENKQK